MDGHASSIDLENLPQTLRTLLHHRRRPPLHPCLVGEPKDPPCPPSTGSLRSISLASPVVAPVVRQVSGEKEVLLSPACAAGKSIDRPAKVMMVAGKETETSASTGGSLSSSSPMVASTRNVPASKKKEKGKAKKKKSTTTTPKSWHEETAPGKDIVLSTFVLSSNSKGVDKTTPNHSKKDETKQEEVQDVTAVQQEKEEERENGFIVAANMECPTYPSPTTTMTAVASPPVSHRNATSLSMTGDEQDATSPLHIGEEKATLSSSPPPLIPLGTTLPAPRSLSPNRWPSPKQDFTRSTVDISNTALLPLASLSSSRQMMAPCSPVDVGSRTDPMVEIQRSQRGETMQEEEEYSMTHVQETKETSPPRLTTWIPSPSMRCSLVSVVGTTPHASFSKCGEGEVPVKTFIPSCTAPRSSIPHNGMTTHQVESQRMAYDVEAEEDAEVVHGHVEHAHEEGPVRLATAASSSGAPTPTTPSSQATWGVPALPLPPSPENLSPPLPLEVAFVPALPHYQQANDNEKRTEEACEEEEESAALGCPPPPFLCSFSSRTSRSSVTSTPASAPLEHGERNEDDAAPAKSSSSRTTTELMYGETLELSCLPDFAVEGEKASAEEGVVPSSPPPLAASFAHPIPFSEIPPVEEEPHPHSPPLLGQSSSSPLASSLVDVPDDTTTGHTPITSRDAVHPFPSSHSHSDETETKEKEEVEVTAPGRGVEKPSLVPDPTLPWSDLPETVDDGCVKWRDSSDEAMEEWMDHTALHPSCVSQHQEEEKEKWNGTPPPPGEKSGEEWCSLLAGKGHTEDKEEVVMMTRIPPASTSSFAGERKRSLSVKEQGDGATRSTSGSSTPWFPIPLSPPFSLPFASSPIEHTEVFDPLRTPDGKTKKKKQQRPSFQTSKRKERPVEEETIQEKAAEGADEKVSPTKARERKRTRKDPHERQQHVGREDEAKNVDPFTAASDGQGLPSVPPSSSRPPQVEMQFEKGMRVEVRWGRSWFPAVITEDQKGGYVQMKWATAKGDSAPLHVKVREVRLPKPVEHPTSPPPSSSTLTQSSEEEEEKSLQHPAPASSSIPLADPLSPRDAERSTPLLSTLPSKERDTTPDPSVIPKEKNPAGNAMDATTTSREKQRSTRGEEAGVGHVLHSNHDGSTRTISYHSLLEEDSEDTEKDTPPFLAHETPPQPHTPPVDLPQRETYDTQEEQEGSGSHLTRRIIGEKDEARTTALLSTTFSPATITAVGTWEEWNEAAPDEMESSLHAEGCCTPRLSSPRTSVPSFFSDGDGLPDDGGEGLAVMSYAVSLSQKTSPDRKTSRRVSSTSPTGILPTEQRKSISASSSLWRSRTSSITSSHSSVVLTTAVPTTIPNTMDGTVVLGNLDAVDLSSKGPPNTKKRMEISMENDVQEDEKERRTHTHPSPPPKRRGSSSTKRMIPRLPQRLVSPSPSRPVSLPVVASDLDTSFSFRISEEPEEEERREAIVLPPVMADKRNTTSRVETVVPVSRSPFLCTAAPSSLDPTWISRVHPGQNYYVSLPVSFSTSPVGLAEFSNNKDEKQSHCTTTGGKRRRKQKEDPDGTSFFPCLPPLTETRAALLNTTTAIRIGKVLSVEPIIGGEEKKPQDEREKLLHNTVSSSRKRLREDAEKNTTPSRVPLVTLALYEMQGSVIQQLPAALVSFSVSPFSSGAASSPYLYSQSVVSLSTTDIVTVPLSSLLLDIPVLVVPPASLPHVYVLKES